MAEDDSSDFTFCQVSPPVDQYPVESPKALPSLQNITLDEPSNDAPKGLEGSSLNNTQSRQTDNSKPVANLKKEQLTKPSSSSGGNTGESGDAVTEKKPVQKKIARAKVPFEKGYSQMDWLKLTRTDPDLAGLKGKSNRRLITLEEVKQHKSTEGHIWTVLKGRVYNISPYFKFHPGGKGIKKSLSNSILVGPSCYLQSGTCVGQVTGLLLTAGFYDLSGVLVEQW